MDAFLQFQFWIAVVGGLLAVRQLALIGAAEQGRKHDLVKKLYKASQDFHISVLIPYLDGQQHPHLLALLQALDDQDYPAEKVAIHLVVSEESARDLFPKSLRPNVKIWQYPAPDPRFEHALTWLIDRCLAAGGNSLFVFLRPTDIVKPDYFQNIVARGFDSFAIQGYVALKNLPETPLAKMLALTTRLFNRIGNAGRFHLGLSCRLMDSGWAIKQEVLEMIPYHRGMDLDNLEYSIRLNLENFRVNWAPNVVVYADSDAHFLHHLTRSVGAFFNRLRLLLQYGPSLVMKSLARLDYNYLEQAVSILKPPYFAGVLGLLTLAALDRYTLIPIPGEPWIWGTLAGTFLILNVMGLFVARCRLNEYGTLLFWTPVVYLMSLIALPVAAVLYARDVLARRSGRDRSYRTVRTTRFNEDLEPVSSLLGDRPNADIHAILEAQGTGWSTERNEAPVPEEEDLLPPPRRSKSAGATTPAAPVRPMREEVLAAPLEEPPVPRMRLPREQVKVVPLSNGKKHVDCLLKTVTTYNDSGQELYQLTLEYKSMAFSTAQYRILDQAFYELQSKLMGRGLTIVTCGSCGNFYNPTADVPGAIRNAGVCLYGKTGREVNLTTDAVTVVSQACPYHCPLNERENIVRQWKESLTSSRR